MKPTNLKQSMTKVKLDFTIGFTLDDDTILSPVIMGAQLSKLVKVPNDRYKVIPENVMRRGSQSDPQLYGSEVWRILGRPL
jgi:hypothetical protein